MSEERTDRIYVHDFDASTATTTPPAGKDLAGWFGVDVNSVKWARFRESRKQVRMAELALEEQERGFVDLLGELQAKVNLARTGQPDDDQEPEEEVPADD